MSLSRVGDWSPSYSTSTTDTEAFEITSPRFDRPLSPEPASGLSRPSSPSISSAQSSGTASASVDRGPVVVLASPRPVQPNRFASPHPGFRLDGSGWNPDLQSHVVRAQDAREGEAAAHRLPGRLGRLGFAAGYAGTFLANGVMTFSNPECSDGYEQDHPPPTGYVGFLCPPPGGTSFWAFAGSMLGAGVAAGLGLAALGLPYQAYKAKTLHGQLAGCARGVAAELTAQARTIGGLGADHRDLAFATARQLLDPAKSDGRAENLPQAMRGVVGMLTGWIGQRDPAADRRAANQRAGAELLRAMGPALQRIDDARLAQLPGLLRTTDDQTRVVLAAAFASCWNRFQPMQQRVVLDTLQTIGDPALREQALAKLAAV